MKNILQAFSLFLVIILCNSQPESCKTNGGDPCVFPFEFEGVRYEKCTNDGSNDKKHWCATATDSNGTVITNNWGECNLNEDSTCDVEKKQTQTGHPNPLINFVQNIFKPKGK